MINTQKQWRYREADSIEAHRLAKEAGISLLTAKVFLSRSIKNPAYIKKFMNPSVNDMHDPFLLEDMGCAVDRILRAIDQKEKIIVYGDYDVDGITSTSSLLLFLRRIGADADYYIPDRMDEGYGLTKSALDKVALMKAKLVITVDCGITAVDEVDYIAGMGVDIIITDHHQCGFELPRAAAVINPNRPDCQYPFKQLAGVGVTLKLIEAICIRISIPEGHHPYFDLAAIGTVADMVPILDENRVIVTMGLRMLEKGMRPGIGALTNVSGLRDKSIKTYEIGFNLGPRINAAGRMGDSTRAVRLLTTDDITEADSLAMELDRDNRQRQETESDILSKAIATIESDLDLTSDKILVVSGEGWHHGIIGIAASKISERYYRPCILLSREGEDAKGSGRSIEGFNLHMALSSCSDLLTRFGGHQQAAGVSIKTQNIHGLRTRINEYAEKLLDEEVLTPKLDIDILIEKSDLTLQAARELQLLEPFGIGNPKPLFSSNPFVISEYKLLSDGKHLKLTLEKEGLLVDAIGFNMGVLGENCRVGGTIEAAFHLQINEWRNMEKVQLNLRAARF